MYSLYTYSLDREAYIVKRGYCCQFIYDLTSVNYALVNLDDDKGWPPDDTVGTFICTFTCVEDLFESYPELFI